MTNLSKPIYFCSECKKITNDLSNLFFVDEKSQKGFCKEECIEDFYFPLIKYFEVIESSFRHKHKQVDELPAGTIIHADIVEETLESPSEVYRIVNELNEAFYSFIKEFNDYSVVVISSVYKKEASFIFLATKTKSNALLTEFRFGELLSDWNLREKEIENENDLLQISRPEEETVDNFEEDEENDEEDNEDMIFIQLLESKKSNLLAEILTKIKDNDIPFEDYTGYESCFQDTLDWPEEVFEKKDKEGDIIFTYIKTFFRGQVTFYYIVICMKRIMESEEVNVYPILALPTIDMEMCQEFRGGTRLSGPLKN